MGPLRPEGAPPLILASSSPARAALLRAAGVAFTAVPALVDEAAMRDALRAEGVPAEEAAVALAELKGRHVAARAPIEAVVLGADQLLEIEGEWLVKPLDLDAAAAQLRRLRGRRHRLVSAVVAFRGGSRVWHHASTAVLDLRAFSDGFLADYLAVAGPGILACVGAYQIEGLGAQLMARVDGDHATVLGLPFLPLLQFLRDQGVLAT
ncbi:MAG: Maf family protein [Geminicoccaceae bacterium]